MSSKQGRHRVLAVSVMLLLIGVGLAGVTVARPAAAQEVKSGASGSIAVTTTTSLSFAPNEFQDVPASATITLAVTDASSVAHTFTIIGKEGWVIPASISAQDFDNLVFGKSPAVVFNYNISTVGTQTTTFTSPPPGWYEFVCTEPGHFQSGMYGFIAFGMNLPANLTVSSGTPGPGAALFIIIGTIVTMVVIALVLGFVVGRRHGARHEMPPERLGYREPQGSESPPLPASEESRHP